MAGDWRRLRGMFRRLFSGLFAPADIHEQQLVLWLPQARRRIDGELLEIVRPFDKPCRRARIDRPAGEIAAHISDVKKLPVGPSDETRHFATCYC